MYWPCGRSLLTPDFHFVSSFGEYRERDAMLDDIWPAVGQAWGAAASDENGGVPPVSGRADCGNRGVSWSPIGIAWRFVIAAFRRTISSPLVLDSPELGI